MARTMTILASAALMAALGACAAAPRAGEQDALMPPDYGPTGVAPNPFRGNEYIEGGMSAPRAGFAGSSIIPAAPPGTPAAIPGQP